MINMDLFEKDIDLKRYNTLKIGGKAKYLFSPENTESLIKNLNYFTENNIKYYILGLGSNVILPDEDFDGVIISLKNFNYVNIVNDICTVGAGVSLPVLNNTLLKEKFTNFAWAGSIPGSVGGSIMGNAEAYKKSMFDDLISITVVINGEIKELKKNEIEHGYRFTSLKNEIILDATFKLRQEDINKTLEDIENWKNFRAEKQPLDKKNAGSTFRNPEKAPAGKLIEETGLKGFMIGGAMVSTKHANFIINENNATSKDIKELINIIKSKVKEKHGVDLILENKIIEWNNL